MSTPTEASSASVGLPKLTGLDWKLGVHISSSELKKISQPFVSAVANFDGHSAVPFEMSLFEFQYLAKHLADITKHLADLQA
ncbi:hypothetical protein PAPYR_1953 [Paratrimastix pyriformis]|uniref:COMM domain-containing protein n=1 Tax=Paratrimastix pyriformis TaxID=342808 RepID=A0ABQ8URC2_9EUKA|nr:hypothetical protein PAPYR_1953 [Paratrimastix pyriformis]